jgi:hypothetical protein
LAVETTMSATDSTPAATGSPDSGLEAAKAAMRAAVAKQKAETTPPADTSKPAETAGEKPAEKPAADAKPATDQKPADGQPADQKLEPTADAKALKTITNLSKENRELKAKLAALESKPAVDTSSEGKDLFAKDPVAALGKFLGQDGEAAAEILLKAYVAGGGAVPPASDVPPDVAALQAEVKKLNEKLTAREKVEQEASTKDAQKAIEKKRDEQIDSWLQPLDLPVVKRPENRAEAIQIANVAVLELAAAKGIPTDTTDPTVIAELYAEAFQIAETQLREKGKRYLATQDPPGDKAPAKPGDQPTKTPPQSTAKQPVPRPAISMQPTKTVLTVEEAQKAASQQMRDRLKVMKAA